ncbi:hypothetical protein [Microvirga massiliensis]|uniref:hypothetical protein n=1 Tax=Microvirga massiliensis TaxID=1033741 RepID=UPI000B039538|nr:hypothetical protein [Microvirga massiliensis]
MDLVTRYAALSGIRIQVLAQAVVCTTPFARRLHEKLAVCLARSLSSVLAQIKNPDADERVVYLSDATGHEYDILDRLVIDRETCECKINNGRWQSAHDGYPFLLPVSEEKSEGLGRFIEEAARYGVQVWADEVHFPAMYDEMLPLAA